MNDIDLLNLNTARGCRISGAAINDFSGWSVSSAGDIDGDGIKDVIIAARLASPSGRPNAGISYVIYGKSGGLVDIDLASLTTAQGFKITGAASSDQSGSSVSSAGDINGDGINDVIIGAYMAFPSGRFRAGISYIIYGKSGGQVDLDLASLTPAQGFKILGDVSNGQVGNSVSSAGDINRDGINDVIIGAPGGRGISYVIYSAKAIVGTIGDDIIFPTLAIEDINGLAGIDTVNYVNSTTGVITSLMPYIFGEAGYAAGDSIVNCENIVGSRFNDTLIGNLDVNLIQGEAGDDVIEGKAGADRLDGGVGNDTLSYTSSAFGVSISLFSGIGTAGDATGDIVSNFENIIGSGLNDTLIGDSNINIIHGDVGNDVIEGKAGADMLDGEAGNDTLSYTSSGLGVSVSLATNTVSGGDAAGDIVSNFENIIGSRSNDILIGDTNINTIEGDLGNDVIEGKAGADRLDGGVGDDTLSYTSSTLGVSVNLASNVVSGGDATGDIVFSFENIIGSELDDILTGDANANDIQGGAGDDTIEGKASGDVLNGGAGINTISYASSSSGVAVDLSTHSASGGDAAGDSISNFVHILGSSFTDILIGDADANNIQGGAGNDTIEGKAGADVLDGETGTNTVSYATSPASVTVDLQTRSARGGDAEGDVLYNFENILGSDYADILTGNANANNIQGNGGDDIIEGKAGPDTLNGGAGINTLKYESSTAGVTINLETGSATGGDATGDSISNFENIIGSDFADILIGDAGDNDLRGGAGDDILRDDGGGNDSLTGGSGEDIFTIRTSPGAVTITDFNSRNDFIDVIRFNVRFDQIMSAAVNNGNNCEITLGDKKIILLNIDRANIQRFWFTSLAPDLPSFSPTMSPVVQPTLSPTTSAPTTSYPTLSPAISPTRQPTLGPTIAPSLNPTAIPT